MIVQDMPPIGGIGKQLGMSINNRYSYFLYYFIYRKEDLYGKKVY